ncbi:MAG: HAD family hydrolase [Myxococcota bacterium]|nr:HAD family hydrolase [Myxococcota bacterium]
MTRSLRCVLFDIDGTLVRMLGAGARAMDRAFEGLTGIRGAFEGIPMAGRTDRAIVCSAIERRTALGAVLPAENALMARFVEAYLPDLEREAASEGPRVCPGVLAAVEMLERRGIAIGLATGNFRGAAEIKLRRFGLWSRFAFGGFGDATRDRAVMLTDALREARRVAGAAPDETLVVGDTEADVAAGKAVGAPTMAVATGPFTADDLAGAGPDLLFEDLTEAVRARFWEHRRGG